MGDGVHILYAGKRGIQRSNGVEHDETSNSGGGALHTEWRWKELSWVTRNKGKYFSLL